MIDELLNGGVVLTATRRLARELHAQFDSAMRAGGSRLWATPRILPLSSWLEECWTLSGQAEVVLAPHQDRFLWQQVVLGSPEAASLLQIAGAAAAAQEAWRLIREWQLPVSEARFVESEDSEAFLRWLRAHQRRCEQSGWIDPPRLMDRVCGLAGSVELPPILMLAGFDELTPQMQRLVAALEESGARWRLVDPPAVPEVHASFSSCRDAEQELRAAAEWAREVVEHQAGVSIGVVIPDLASLHAIAERIFTEILNPEVALLDVPAAGRAFHIALGGKLGEYPIVHSALMILELAHGSLALARMGSLLRSPFVGGASSERSNRALTDAFLRKPHPSSVSFVTLKEACRKHSPVLARLLEKWEKVQASLPPKALPSSWSSYFARLLGALEWPGSESLTSLEHQAVGEWQELLSRYAALDAVVGLVSLTVALGALQQLASEIGFQAENEGQPVQIMGIPETAGLGFDYLWIAGMTDEAWPRPAGPNPFLPISLQRSAGLPRSTARRELDYAVRTTARLLNCAGTVVVSCAQREQDRALRRSPLFTELEDLPLREPPDGFWPPPAALETIGDAQAPAAEPELVTQGGTRILELQAKCPFRAFAEIRLGARSLEVSQTGLNARDRGSLLHIVLERVWSELRTQAALKELTPEELDGVIGTAIEGAFRHRHHKPSLEDPFEREIRSIEAVRLQKLVVRWLEVEKQRAAFTVHEQELSRRVSIGELQFDARIDRVDRLASGREVIIDYKTGEVSVDEWSGDRPESPQLPLYALAHDQPIGAISFAQIRPEKLIFAGVAQEAGALPDVPASDVATRMAEWKVVFERLAGEFAAGDARVDPKTFPATCAFCQLPALCRISAAVVEAEE